MCVLNFIACLLVVLTMSGCSTSNRTAREKDTPEARAVAFLVQEVPAWSRDNGCHSCHNNGDAARALYAASTRGFNVPASALRDTTAWVTQPARWDHNKGDPGFSDKRLADIQFAASLLAAVQAGRAEGVALDGAGKRLIRGQTEDGSWPVGPGRTLGSPVTYGTVLATHMAVQTLARCEDRDAEWAAQRGMRWLRMTPISSVPEAATLLLALPGDRARRVEALAYLRQARTSDKAWGPYPNTPAEPFDTALALLALAPLSQEPEAATLIREGRRWLLQLQEPDGGWPATTRPARGQSYAQRISTTGWVTLALLATREAEP